MAIKETTITDLMRKMTVALEEHGDLVVKIEDTDVTFAGVVPAEGNEAATFWILGR